MFFPLNAPSSPKQSALAISVVYAYVGNDPLNLVDPTGLAASAAWGLLGNLNPIGSANAQPAMALCAAGPAGCAAGAGITAGQILLGGASEFGTGAIILNNQDQGNQSGITLRPDLPPLSGGRSGQKVPGLTGRPNSAIPGAANDRIFITDDNGNVVVDVLRSSQRFATREPKRTARSARERYPNSDRLRVPQQRHPPLWSVSANRCMLSSKSRRIPC